MLGYAKQLLASALRHVLLAIDPLSGIDKEDLMVRLVEVTCERDRFMAERDAAQSALDEAERKLRKANGSLSPRVGDFLESMEKAPSSKRMVGAILPDPDTSSW